MSTDQVRPTAAGTRNTEQSPSSQGALRPLVLKVWSSDEQNQHHPGTCEKRKPTQDLLNQKFCSRAWQSVLSLPGDNNSC